MIDAELKKVQRRLHQTRKELLGLLSQQERMRSTATPSDNKNSALSGATPETEEWQALAERISDAQRRLRLHLDDLNYIRVLRATRTCVEPRDRLCVAF